MNEEERQLEEAEAFRRRYREGRLAGMIPEEALEFAASGADVGELRKLVKAGCPPEQIRGILV